MDQTTDPCGGAPAFGAARDERDDAVPYTLRRDCIQIQQTPIGYLCLGFGEAARTLRFIFDDGPATSRAFGDPRHLPSALDLHDIVRAPVVGATEPFGKARDRYLDRLAALALLTKSGGYDPDEPRDEDGRWTSGGIENWLHEASTFLAAAGHTLSTGARQAFGAAERIIESSAARAADLVDRNAPRLLSAAGYGLQAVGAAIDLAGILGVPETFGGSLVVEGEGTSLIAEGRVLTAEAEALAAAREGSFSITNWARYPSNLPRPRGPFRLIEGQEYEAARAAANRANRAIRKADPAAVAGKQVHEIQPVKFGGSPTDPANKIYMTKPDHKIVSAWWLQMMSKLLGYK